MQQGKFKKYFILLGSLQVFVAAGAIPAGVLLLADSSGAKLGMSPDILNKSPFSTFLIPGLFLLLIIGITNVAGAILSFRKNKYSGITGIVLGLILCLWIIFQVKWIGFNSFLQPLFLLIGFFEAFAGWKILKLKPI